MPYTTEKKVQPVRVKLYCNCGKEMKRSDEVLSSFPIKYIYYCEIEKNVILNSLYEPAPRDRTWRTRPWLFLWFPTDFMKACWTSGLKP